MPDHTASPPLPPSLQMCCYRPQPLLPAASLQIFFCKIIASSYSRIGHY
uniref:Uncharacterized protein n=1 Tax=Setaria italica TaxID=4555 RepID=K3YNN2_SETIT